MYNFTFNIPTKIHFGKDTISSLSELKAYGSKVLLVYGGGSIKKNGLYDTAMKILKDAGLTVFELSGVEPNPKIETVRKGTESELLYIGFWTDKGNADSDTLDFLSKLKNKKIFLFGTAGFGGSDAYFQRILGNVKSAIDSSNTIVGEYMCQGKMPQSVRERYVKMKENPEHPDNIDTLIENFDKALSHPDADDMEQLKNIII